MIKLTIEEKNALDELTHKNKMDCWFWIDDENDCVRDLEDDDKILDTAEAVLEVLDGTPDIYEFLDDDQATVITKLYNRIIIDSEVLEALNKYVPDNISVIINDEDEIDVMYCSSNNSFLINGTKIKAQEIDLDQLEKELDDLDVSHVW